MKTDYTRQELLALCERAIVAEGNWSNRDTAGSQQQVGECWALLKAGSNFRIRMEGENATTDEGTIWIDVAFDGFLTFEYGMNGQ